MTALVLSADKPSSVARVRETSLASNLVQAFNVVAWVVVELTTTVQVPVPPAVLQLVPEGKLTGSPVAEKVTVVPSGAAVTPLPVFPRRIVRPPRPGDASAVRLVARVARVAYDPRMTRFLHTMYRITDPERSRRFYEALGLEYRRELPIVRNGELEATNYFFAAPGGEVELELTFNHDARGYEVGTGYGHIALGVDDLRATLERLAGEGIEPEREPYRVREGGSLLCFVRDPDNYRIELIERPAS
jgi:lactoylglutathione lyase